MNVHEMNERETNAKDKAALAAQKAKESATAALDAAAEAGRSVKASLKTHAADTLDTVREAASEGAATGRDKLVGVADRLADTLESEANATSGVPSRMLGGIASGVTSVSDTLRDRTVSELMADAKAYAQRNPGTFALGAAVAGFALARFMRSSGVRHSAEARAAHTTDRIYRDAARRTVDTLGRQDEGSRP